MYLTHTFAHRATLSRAHDWLTRVGFHPRHINADTPSAPRLMIPVEAESLAAAQMLINAAESADPDGFPSVWDKAEASHGALTERYHDSDSAWQNEPRSSVIGWHPLD
jgi:hypothetical protein